MDASAFTAAKLDALRAHRTQITADAPFFLVGKYGDESLFGIEHYRLVHGTAGADRDHDGYETDLFAGLA